jgi:hypothetical protein
LNLMSKIHNVIKIIEYFRNVLDIYLDWEKKTKIFVF